MIRRLSPLGGARPARGAGSCALSVMEAEVGRTIRRLMRCCTRVALGTLDREDGSPYVSLAMVALDHDASPLLYLSDLADHTKNLKRLPRVSLLFDGTLDHAVPLAGERATVQGRAAVIDDPRLLARYTARHPDAAVYSGFRDFNLYRVAIERAHLVAGFGRIHWVGAEAIRMDGAEVGPLPDQEADIVEHMNADHADAVELYATRLLGRTGEGWQLDGVDPEGCDLRRGAEIARLWFDKPVQDAGAARVELVRLVRRARGEAAGG
jgi:putative heme iron utilization protein